MINGSAYVAGSDECVPRQLSWRRIIWSAALIWTCLVAALMLGTALADPGFTSPVAVSSLGLIWIAVFAGILFVGRRFCESSRPGGVSLFDALDVQAGEQCVIFADAAMAMVDQKGRLRTVNEHFCRILGRTPGE
ncbi:MAG: PAS domain-containing protein, partial [Thermogutta sp.]